MADSKTNVVVHIDENLDDQRIREIERLIGSQPGVVSACVNENARHLLVVDYDPTGIQSSDILARVRDNGVHAELVGL
jgi:hypothetical protein